MISRIVLAAFSRLIASCGAVDRHLLRQEITSAYKDTTTSGACDCSCYGTTVQSNVSSKGEFCSCPGSSWTICANGFGSPPALPVDYNEEQAECCPYDHASWAAREFTRLWFRASKPSNNSIKAVYRALSDYFILRWSMIVRNAPKVSASVFALFTESVRGQYSHFPSLILLPDMSFNLAQGGGTAQDMVKSSDKLEIGRLYHFEYIYEKCANPRGCNSLVDSDGKTWMMFNKKQNVSGNISLYFSDPWFPSADASVSNVLVAGISGNDIVVAGYPLEMRFGRAIKQLDTQRNFKMSFDITLYSIINQLTNVFYFEDQSKYKRGSPGVYIVPGTSRIVVYVGSSDCQSVEFCYNDHGQTLSSMVLGKQYSFELIANNNQVRLEQVTRNFGETTPQRSVWLTFSSHPGKRISAKNTNVYISSPFHTPSNATIAHFMYTKL